MPHPTSRPHRRQPTPEPGPAARSSSRAPSAKPSLRQQARSTHVAHVRVEWLDPDLLFAHCMDATGHRYVADARSAVSLSALSEGMEIDVLAYPSGLVKSLVFEDEPGGAEPAAAARPHRARSLRRG